MSVVVLRRVSLAYIARSIKEPDYGDNPTTLLAGRAHCSELVSLEKELSQRFPHEHILYNQDNGMLLNKLSIGLAYS